MAKKGQPAVIPQQSTLSPAKAIDVIQRLIAQAREMQSDKDLSNGQYEAWRTTLHDYVKQSLGYPNETVDSIVTAGNCWASWGDPTEYQLIAERHENLNKITHYLHAAIEQLNFRLSLEPVVEPRSEKDKPQVNVVKDTVFIVHGHNETIKHEVGRLIHENLRLKSLILGEQTSEGDTVIEKLERYGKQSQFAVVLMTADDRGGLKTESPEKFQLRARLNVIFELGYFVAELGRKNVCVLYEEGVEIPSDMMGVIYIKIDPAGAWKFALAKEIKTAGFNVDMNNI